MKTNSLFLFLVGALSSSAAVIACGHSDGASEDGAAGAAAISANKTQDIKDAAKAAFATVQKLDDKGKFDKLKSKDVDVNKKGCYQVFAQMLPDDKKSELDNVRIHAVGANLLDLHAAVDRFCNVIVITPNKLQSSCDTDAQDFEVRSYDKSACDDKKVYVGLIGEDKAAEDFIGKHHHYDQLKDGELAIAGFDDSEDD
jgi:hypothetical protein